MCKRIKIKMNGPAIGCLICIISALLVVLCLTLVVKYVIDNLRPSEKVEQVESVAVHKACAAADPFEVGTLSADEWWDPESAVVVYPESNTPAIHSDALDYNINTTLWGWEGHGMEVWEMDLYARIVYLEFWGCSPECVEAGADSILQLWKSGYFGRTMFETLSATAEDGSLVYSPYAYVWDWTYDADGLAEIRAVCEQRFYNGPEWCAPFFRLWYYHPWAIPCYELDGVYFSTSPFLQ